MSIGGSSGKVATFFTAYFAAASLARLLDGLVGRQRNGHNVI